MDKGWTTASVWRLAAVLAVALLVRGAAGVWWQQRLPPGRAFAFGDSEGYWQLARTIARGEPYAIGPDRLRIFRTPGYPAVLAPLFWIWEQPPVLAGRAVSAVLATLAVGGVAGLAGLLFDRRTALVAAALAACYPEAIALGVFVLSEAPFAPLMMLQLVLWTLAWRSRTPRSMAGWSLAAGVAAGLATLMRPSWLLFVPFAGLVGVGATRDRRRHAAIVAVMLAGLGLTLAPWWVRNYRVAGRFVPTSLQVGASLYDGLSPSARGGSDMRFVPAFTAEQRAADAASPSPPPGTFEDRLDRRLRDAALAWTREHPAAAARLAIVKFVRMWSPLPNAQEFQSFAVRLALAGSYVPVLLLALAGAWRFAGRDWPYALCLLPAVYFTGLHVVFVSSIRYRQPAMLPLIVLAAGVLAPWIAARWPVAGARQS